MILTAARIADLRSFGFRKDNSLVVVGSRIIDMGSAAAMVRKYRYHRVVRLDNCILLPGLVNCHAHLELPHIPPPRRAGSYASWVLNLLRAKKHLSSNDYRKAAAANIRELIATGTTTVADISTHCESLEALRRSGMRALVYHEILSIRPEERLRNVVPRGMRGTALVRHGLSPHSPHTTSEHVLTYIKALARRRGLPVCMHVSETADEHLLLRGKASGLDELYRAARWDIAWAPRASSSFSYLHRVGMLDRSFLAVHAVHSDGRDRSLLSRSGASIAHCPRSNARIGVGTMPLKACQDAGITVGLGTDSLASVPTLNLWDEMRFALTVHRRAGVSAFDILSMATIEGARALGMADRIGSLEPGKRADIIAVPLPRRRSGDPFRDLISQTDRCIFSVINGRVLIDNRDQRGRSGRSSG